MSATWGWFLILMAALSVVWVLVGYVIIDALIDRKGDRT